MKLFRVLHLSDIHIGDTYMNSKDIAYRIISDLESNDIDSINSIIVTGDIFEGKYNYDKTIISEAVDFFNIIYNELKTTSKIEKTDFLFVPGNHDVLRNSDPSVQWKKYSEFLTEFYGTIPSFYETENYSLIKKYDEHRILFAGFNSCGLKEEPLIDAAVLNSIKKINESQFEKSDLEKKNIIDFLGKQTNSKTFVDYGEIKPQQLLNIRREIEKYDDYNIIAFFHHHFYLFPEIYTKYGDSSLIRNYTNIIQQLQQAGVKTVLHGHKHFDLERPLITESYYDNANNITNVIAGGSVGTSRTNRHTFNVIDFFDEDENNKIIQRKFIYNNDHLEPITLKQIPPQANENNSKVKLLNILKLNNLNLYSEYINARDSINIVANDYSNMTQWLENIFIGFNEIHKTFENDCLCVFFLLYAMNYRILKIKQLLGKESIDTSYYKILNELLFDKIPEIGFNKKQYLKIFEECNHKKLKEEADNILENIQNKKAKKYLSFSMIGIFITDIYLMLRYYADSFYNNRIKYKVNINLNEAEFHQNVPVNRIMIHSDADRRSAYIDLKCNSATAHKLAVLFIKEFELTIQKFEDYFNNVGLKLYYLTPKIENKDSPNAIDNYNFEAYIPTLIPLLTGDNIYERKEVFARELIQNSIDAIAVRASTEDDFDKTIYITLGQTQGKKFFKIKDYGTGMDSFKIERYFTSIGRSFYSGDEYQDLELEYKPISNFGIGFLSAFMICREIDVKTRYYLEEKEGLKLHIPNYDGCFFIEKDNNLDIGTEITLYIDSKISRNIKAEQIVNYIRNTMLDIAYDIVIHDEINMEQIKINSKYIRNGNVDHKKILFVPFSESGDIVEDVKLKEKIWSGKYIADYPYGLLINLSRWDKLLTSVLNSGIKLSHTSVNDIWDILLGYRTQRSHSTNSMFAFNFPSNYINIDVSREKIANLINSKINPNFKYKLINEIYNQTLQFLNYNKTETSDIPGINLHLLMMFLTEVCTTETGVAEIDITETDITETDITETNDIKHSFSILNNKIKNEQFVLYIRFNNDSIDLLVARRKSKPNSAIAYVKYNYSKCFNSFNNFISQKSMQKQFDKVLQKLEYLLQFIPSLIDMRFNHDGLIARNYDEYYHYQTYVLGDNYSTIKFHLEKLLKEKNDNIVYSFLLISAFALKMNGDKEHKNVMENILSILLEKFTVSDIEQGLASVSISYEDIKSILKKIKNV